MLAMPSYSRRLVRVGLLSALLVFGCSTSVEQAFDPPPTTPVISSATPVVEGADGVETVDWPSERPADFAATFNQDGGMAPWSEQISVAGDAAEYEVWMNDITYSFGYAPGADRLDELYRTFRDGRFETYRIVPFAEGDQIYDAESTSWRASFQDFSHRVSTSGEDIESDNSGSSPLTFLTRFVDSDQVPAASNPLTVTFDSGSIQPPGRLTVHFDLGEATFAMGDERWAQEFMIYWSGEPQEVPVTVTEGLDADETILVQTTVPFEPGGQVLIALGATGQVTVTEAQS